MAGTATATPMEIDEFINGALVSWVSEWINMLDMLIRGQLNKNVIGIHKYSSIQFTCARTYGYV